MKIHFIILSLLLSAITAMADFRTWTNAEGKQAELDLYDVTERDGEKAGRFRMKNGQTVVLKVSQLNAEDGKALSEWAPSVFVEDFDGNLVILNNGRFEEVRSHTAPNKYYVFYYTAYWCPPCRAFTPSLVSWYNKNKNDNFELILITSDNDKSDMLTYAKDKKMPWPQLSFTKAKGFKKKHKHGVSGIPSLILCDLQGKVLGNYRSNLDALTQMVR